MNEQDNYLVICPECVHQFRAIPVQVQQLMTSVGLEPPFTGPSALTPTENVNGLAWAVSCWRAEVANRPLINVHRRTLDDTWRQVIRYFGGDPVKLLGPAHDHLLMAEREERAWKPPQTTTCEGGGRE